MNNIPYDLFVFIATRNKFKRFQQHARSIWVQLMNKQSKHLRIDNLDFIAYIKINSINIIDITYCITKNYPEKKSNDVLDTKYLLKDLNNYIIFIDINNNIMLFYSLVKKGDFYTVDAQLKNFIKEQKVANIILRI